MSYSLTEQQATFGGGLQFDNQRRPPKFIVPFQTLNAAASISNLRFYSASTNNEVDIQVDANTPQRLWTGFADTSNFVQARLVGHVVSAGPANSEVRLRYSTQNVDGSFLPMKKGGLPLGILTSALGWADSGWQDMAPGSIGGSVYLRLFCFNQADDLTNYAALIPLEVWFR